MKRTLLEYASSDKFILLFLTSDKLANSNRGTITVHRDSFDADVMAMFDDTLGIPDMIACTDYKVNIDDEYNLHGSESNTEIDKKFSFVATSFKLMWYGVNHNTNGPTIFHRPDGPASITFRNYKTYHDHGRRNSCDMISSIYRWYKDGKQVRSAGPHLIRLKETNIVIDSSGNIRTRDSSNVVVDFTNWNHPSDNTNIISDDINRALIDGKIEINIMSRSDTVFNDRLDEAAFYSTV